jgi:hypothetical protein
LIDTRIVRADFFRRMGEVKFHRPTTTRLEVYEERPLRSVEQIARLRANPAHQG